MAAMPFTAVAGDAAQPGLLRLEPLTVLGTRTQQTTASVSRSIDVIGTQQIARQQSADLGEIVDGLANVSLTGSPRSVGEGISIRGLSGDRLLVLVDGVRQDFPSGHLTQTFIDPELIETVEVERGPASVLWGSGALGGVVSVRTKDAADLLADDEDFGARAHVGYESAGQGWLTGGAVYGRLNDHVDALFQYDRRSNEDLKLGNGRRLPHSAYRRNSALAKSTLHLAPGNSLQLSYRRLRLDGQSPNNPAEPVSSRNSLLDREVAVDVGRAEWRLLPESMLVDLKAGLSYTRTEVDERQRTVATHKNIDVDGYAMDVANTSRFDFGLAGRHALTYGIDANHERVGASENGRPMNSIPDAKRLLAGVFIQDEIKWTEAWKTTLGLRYDRYKSDADRAGLEDHDDDALSVQAGLLWQASDWLQLYASYAEAFRAPSLTELYATGTHFGANHFVPNPALKPERAANKEFGLRSHWQGLFMADDRLKFKASVFRNDVRDFIDTVVTTVPLPPPDYIGGTTRSENVTDARLQGFEAELEYTIDAWFIALSYGQTRGNNKTDHQPLADVAADTWVVRAGVTALPWDGRITWRMTHAEAQNRVPSGGDVEPTPAYTVHDLLTSWHPTPDLRVEFGIGNITNRSYRRHNSALEEAGRSIKLGMTLTF
ncbi:MAG TPA: TonB-dependent hemoglobin/transferrin/lactoferrin family receptor [Salinisphaeraceae bacterium]|nr:TonB-dependent hemoglobin/transferrin/lactoferrin family receptor [Salinisphaeraceae bacterium]